MPAALLSRFDLIFILLDQPNKENDLNLAMHIGNVHKTISRPKLNVFQPSFIRAYVSIAKQFEPKLPEDLYETLMEMYISKRKEGISDLKEGYTYTTTRSLLGLIRLCQARAKLRFSE